MNRDIIDDIMANGTDNNCVMDFDIFGYHEHRIVPMDDRIKALEQGEGKEGHEVEFKEGLYPDLPDTPDTPEYRAILWRYKQRAYEDEDVWKLLVFKHEIQGEQGIPGEPGEPGKGLGVKGVVDHQNDLTTLNPPPALNDIYMVRGVNELWIYYKEDPNHIRNWQNLGKIVGVTGPRGPRGPQGPKGEAGGIGQFLLQWIIDGVTSSVISTVMVDVSSMVNDAVNDAMLELTNVMEDMAQSAVEKAIEDAGDSFRGDKGDKGDKGDDGEDGKDGRSCQIVGSYSMLTLFRAAYPPTDDNVGKAALIGDIDGDKPRELWAITKSMPLGVIQYENFGDIQGPKGDPGKDAEWAVSVRDRHFTEKFNIDVYSDMAEGVAGLYLQETDSIVYDPLSGGDAYGHVGYKIRMKYPIPTLIPKDDVGGITTSGKFLTNDGTKLIWKKVDDAPEPIFKRIKMKSQDGNLWSITIGNDGRLCVEDIHDAV